MADPNFKKISDMVEITTVGTNVFVPVIDMNEAADADKNKKIKTTNLRKGIANSELAGGITAAKIAGLSTDPNGDRMVFWDDGAGALAYLEPGSGLTITDTTIDLDHLGIEDLADPGADRIGFWDDSASKMDWLIPGAGLTIDNKTINAGVGTNELAAGSVTNPIIRDSAALSVIGRSANSAGDVADIVAGTDGHVLRRAGTAIGFGTVARAGLAADIIDGTKIADDAVNSEHIAAGAVDLEHMSANSIDSDQYVDGSIDQEHLSVGASKVTNRQGGNATSWVTAGTTDYALASARIQVGSIGSSAGGDVSVTFPVAFATGTLPLVFITILYESTGAYYSLSNINATGFDISVYAAAGTRLGRNVFWLAIGAA